MYRSVNFCCYIRHGFTDLAYLHFPGYTFMFLTEAVFFRPYSDGDGKPEGITNRAFLMPY